MPTAERPPQLINPYGCEPDPVDESSGSARVVGRALVIGTLGVGAATALTGTGFAYDGGSGSGGSDLSFDFSSSDSREAGSTSAIDADFSKQVSYVPPREMLLDPYAPDGPTSPDFPQKPLPDSEFPVEPVAPVVPLRDSDVPVKPSSSSMLPQRDTYRDSSIEAYRVPQHPFDLAPDMNVSFSGEPAVVAPSEVPAGPVPEANRGGFNNNVPVPADSEPTGVPASPLIMPTATPITTFLLPGYQGDAEVSTPSFTDQSKPNWVGNLQTVDTNPGSRTFERVVPRSDNARSVNDFPSRDVPGLTLSPYFLSTPYPVPPASGPTAAPTPVPLSESLNIDRVGASGPSFGTSNTPLADTLQIRSGGPSSDGMFFSTASSRLPGPQDGRTLVASSAVSDSGGLLSANRSPALVTRDSGRPFTLTPAGEVYASKTLGSPSHGVIMRGSGNVPPAARPRQQEPAWKQLLCGGEVGEILCGPNRVHRNPRGTAIIRTDPASSESPYRPVLTDKVTYTLCWWSRDDCALYEPYGDGQRMRKLEGARGTPEDLPIRQIPRKLRP